MGPLMTNYSIGAPRELLKFKDKCAAIACCHSMQTLTALCCVKLQVLVHQLRAATTGKLRAATRCDGAGLKC